MIDLTVLQGSLEEGVLRTIYRLADQAGFAVRVHAPSDVYALCEEEDEQPTPEQVLECLHVLEGVDFNEFEALIDILNNERTKP